MPAALINNASPSASGYKPREIEMGGGVRRREPEPVVCPIDDDAIAKKPHKQSFDYIWRTGVAGGVAASAVCASFPHNFPIPISSFSHEFKIVLLLMYIYLRPKPWLPPSTESKSSSKPPIPNSGNTRALGLAS
jgi:hypothetical protein